MKLRIEDVLREHGGMIERIAAGYARTPTAREELAQEMAIAIWRALPRFRGDGSLKAFVARTAQFTALDALHRHDFTREVAMDGIDMEAADPTPDQLAEKSQRQRRMAAAITSLPLGQRECVLLALEGFGNKEIAEILGIEPNTADQRLSRARAGLRYALGEQND
jgi:RNA polymerase sigma-70 factor (ECF subfamily)